MRSGGDCGGTALQGKSLFQPLDTASVYGHTKYFAGKLQDMRYSEEELAMALAGLPLLRIRSEPEVSERP